MTYKTDMSKEREAFERALTDLAAKHGEALSADDFSRDASGAYDNGATEIAWMLWRARASIDNPSFDAADMATASAQGFRDGVASIAASAPGPSGQIKEPYTLAEIKAKIASNDYSAELMLQHAMLHLDRLAASAGSEPVAADGWLHENGLLYRLTDERCPCNRDEINVTMADGSRSIEARSRRALELLDRIRATHPSPPEGMVMVPKVPTMAMRIAAKTADMDHTNLSDWMVSDWPEFNRIWDAMLKAAPPTSSADSRKGE